MADDLWTRMRGIQIIENPLIPRDAVFPVGSDGKLILKSERGKKRVASLIMHPDAAKALEEELAKERT